MDIGLGGLLLVSDQTLRNADKSLHPRREGNLCESVENWIGSWGWGESWPRVCWKNSSPIGLDQWLQPGGHCKPGETTLETASREPEEETSVSRKPCALIPRGAIESKDLHPFLSEASTPGNGRVLP